MNPIKANGRRAAGVAGIVFGLLCTGAAAAQEPPRQPDARKVLEMIEANGNLVYVAAAANMDLARARLLAARAHLSPRLTFESKTRQYEAESVRGRGSWDFPITLKTTEDKRSEARNTVILEGLAVYFDLHASELLLRSLYENHSSAYVRWNRAKKRQAMGREDPVKVAERLSRVEWTRLAFYRERSRNQQLRFRLETLTGTPFKDELVDPPKVPERAPPKIDMESLFEAVKAGNPQIRVLTREMQYKITTLWMSRQDSWQQVIAARAMDSFTRKSLLRRQQLYEQDRVASLGQAMRESTESESELVRAIGAFYFDNAGLAVLLGENPARGLNSGFPTEEASKDGSALHYEPKGGSGFGQNDQNEVN